MISQKHTWRHRDAAARKAFDLASSQGWTVLVLGRGFYFSVLENYFRNVAPLYAGEQVFIVCDSDALHMTLSGGGEIIFVDYTPGQERGQELLEGNQVADLIFVAEDRVGSMLPVLKNVVYPIMDRSGQHCALNMLGDQNDSDVGEY